MQRSVVNRFMLVIVTAVVIAVGALSVTFIARARSDSQIIISGQTVPLIKQAQMMGSAGAQEQLDLSIGLKAQNQQELDALLSNLYNPRSPLYHHFLTPQEYAARFSPTHEQQQQVVSYLRSKGVTVTQIAPNGMFINARASVATVEAAFNVKINNYQIGPRKFYANAAAPSIPEELSSVILSIGGMDNSVRWKPLNKRASSAQPVSQKNAQDLQPMAGYAPTDFKGAYNIKPLEQAGVQGAGQSVAVFELDGYNPDDIAQFVKKYNLPTPDISTVLVDGAANTPGAGAIEVELDIEIIAAMAPKASQIVYIGPNSTQGVNDTYNKIVTDNKTQITSISWGLCEAQSGNAELQALNAIFKQGAAQGMTMYAAAGDSGAYDCNDNNLAVDSPASDPYITGVGGTKLQVNNGAYGSESVWSSPTDTQRSPKGAGGGGGLSSFFPIPDWQKGPGVQNQYSNGKRQVPDISADADPETGYAIYCTAAASGCPSSGNVVVGGTSAAAPLWAGSTALINEYLQKQNKSRVGFISPLLYELASSQQKFAPFNDVASGDNLFYKATSNYDLGSGIGSPNVFNIAQDVAGGNLPTPTPTPGGTPTPTPIPTTTPTPVPSSTAVPPTPTPGLSPTAAPPTPVPGGSLIKNGDFEAGTDSWQESSAAGYELVDKKNPHGGKYSAYLCGYSRCNDVIGQNFTVPQGVTTASVSYWWYGHTTRTSSSCSDTLSALLLDSRGRVIGKLQSSCNTAANQQWQQVTVDVTSLLKRYGGQSVMLVFGGQTTATKATTAFFVDDVAVTVQ